MGVIASLQDANKIYKVRDTTITALDKTTLDIHTGELKLIMDPSGSGKTILLSLIGLWPQCFTIPNLFRISL